MRSKEKNKREEMKKQKEWPEWMRKGEKKRRGRPTTLEQNQRQQFFNQSF